MNKPLGIPLLVIAAILLIVGFNESHSFSSEMSGAFHDSPSDAGLWCLIGGGVASALGLFFTLSESH